MAAAQKEILPKGDYEIGTVGPSRAWDFDGNDGKVYMATDQVQLVGYEQYWVDVNRAAKADPPKKGDKITGTVTQDEDGKYSPKFNKEKKGGGGYRGGGGGQAGPGAVWSSAVETASRIVGQYAALTGKKPTTMDKFLAQVEAVAPKVNDMVDRLVAKAKPADKPADTTNSEAGETKAAPSANAKTDTVIEDISDEDLDGEENW